MLLGAALALAVVPAGCSKSEKPPEPAVSGVDLSPVPAPAGLIAEAFMPTPDATWAKARIAVGGPAMFLPVNIGTLVVTVLGLPPTVATEIDGGVPMLGAAVEAGPEAGAGPEEVAPDRRPFAVIAVHVKSGTRFVDQVTRGEGARFQARVDAGTSITFLEPMAAAPAGSSSAQAPAPAPAPASTQGRLGMGVLGNYLVLGATAEDVLAVGPYVARTMSRATAPREDVVIEAPRAAVAGPITGGARRVWERIRPSVVAGGGAGGSTLVPTVDGWIALLGDLERARLSLVLDEAAHLRFEATPRAGDGPAGKAVAAAAVGNVKPLLELPADALAGLLVRESKAGRGEAIASQVDAVLGFLGGQALEKGTPAPEKGAEASRKGAKAAQAAEAAEAQARVQVPEKEREQIAAALRGVSEARGDWFTVGLRWEGTGPTAMARLAVDDEKKMQEALGDFEGLTTLPSIKALLKQEGLSITAGKYVVERMPGDVRRLKFARTGEKEGAKRAAASKGEAPKGEAAPKDLAAASLPRAINLLHFLKGGALYASAGYEPDEGMRQVVGAVEGGNLGGVGAVRAALEGLGSEASFVLFVDPLRLMATRAGNPAPAEVTPVVISAGASPAKGGAGALWGRVDVPTAVVKELVRRRGAL
ncbi:Autotransporter adhesin [Chondromyces apiculatus DSM 436]|uniref:Autotransporter adhesin n=1 Tax=Chondromyces apiculatus DSM 436 TaxID=1192034 RepID=A0A017SUN5_9BACT|nr:Autotransporter adhesin [Chondromyces apiculatus DSM 436]